MRNIVGSLFLVAATAGCQPQWTAREVPYEYHLGTQGAILWRCDRRTGQAAWTTATAGAAWHIIRDPVKIDFEPMPETNQ